MAKKTVLTLTAIAGLIMANTSKADNHRVLLNRSSHIYHELQGRWGLKAEHPDGVQWVVETEDQAIAEGGRAAKVRND
jgi:hypothetical protein